MISSGAKWHGGDRRPNGIRLSATTAIAASGLIVNSRAAYPSGADERPGREAVTRLAPPQLLGRYSTNET